MSDISKISVNNNTYDIKDAKARADIGTITTGLGNLAYKNEASGVYTPSGTVSAPSVDVTPTSSSINDIDVSVDTETLVFTSDTKTIVTGIASVSASQPIFSGTQGTITVS